MGGGLPQFLTLRAAPVQDASHRESLDRALSLSQSRRSKPVRRPASSTGSNVSLSLNTLKLFEAAASLSGPLQAQRGKLTLPKQELPESHDEILIEVGDVSPSRLACS